MSTRMAQIYGYLVCLVAVITFLVCLGNVVSASFDLANPLYAWGDFDQVRSLSSVENYRMEVLGNLPSDQPSPDEASIQAMYDAARDAQMHAVWLRSVRNITVSALLLVVSLVLFFTHMRWLKRLA